MPTLEDWDSDWEYGDFPDEEDLLEKNRMTVWVKRDKEEELVDVCNAQSGVNQIEATCMGITEVIWESWKGLTR